MDPAPPVTTAEALAFGLVAGAFAAAMAFLIVYDGYRRHRLAGRRALRHALRTAAFAFVVFLLLAVVAGYALRWAVPG